MACIFNTILIINLIFNFNKKKGDFDPNSRINLKRPQITCIFYPQLLNI